MTRYSYSRVSTYATCPRLYQLRYIHQLSPLQESEHDLRFGKAWDAALNVYYRGQGVEQSQVAFIEAYPENEYPDPLPYWSPGKSFAAGISGLNQYVQKWREDDAWWEVLTVQSRDEKDGDDESRVVVLDLVVRDKRDGMVYGVDSKTTGKYLDAQYAAQFDPHSQIRQYVRHLQEEYGEVGGFYINAASFRHRTKAYTPRKGPDKGVQLPAGDWQDFKRYLFNPNAEAINQEKASWSNWIRKIESDVASGDFAYNTDQCVRGPLTCPYHKICSAGYTWPNDAMLIEPWYRQRCLLLVNGERCWLAPEHDGPCDSTRPAQADYEVNLDDEVEDAEV